MAFRTSLCDLGWTIAKLEIDEGEAPLEEGGSILPPNPESDTLTLLQPADEDGGAISLAITSREALLRLRDFIDETLEGPDAS